MQVKISVIIPTYKPQSYLWECLDSLSSQTLCKNDFEIVLVLNGCDEPYRSQIQGYINSHKELNIKYIHTLIGGVSNARNVGLNIACGEYVTFIDDDDLVSSQFLEELYSNASVNSVVLCYPYAFNDGNLQQQLPYHITDVYDFCCNKDNNMISSKVRKYFSGPCMKLIPMRFIQDRRFDVRFKNGEDTLFMFLISDRIKDIKFTSKNAIYYRRNRVGSAVNIKRTFSELFHSNLLQIKTYIRYFIQNPFGYNFTFFLSRIGGSLYAIIMGLLQIFKNNE